MHVLFKIKHGDVMRQFSLWTPTYIVSREDCRIKSDFNKLVK
uniref:Uncharacterized protein n=1 Tax=Physcomitrium patens TaxID=3218 RepID=A0A2K1KB19_PHYPA|nr:hypothetical protein PHYPA_010156 [Physcomitrium patens]